MFRLPYTCEWCDTLTEWLPSEVPDVCPACDDTGDCRSNIEKYGCKTNMCEHYIWKNDSCKLVQPYLIEDINCPLKDKK